MDLTGALLDALKSAAGPNIRRIERTSTGGILLTHASGTQLMVNAAALAPHIMGDPARVVAEANGALAALERMAAEAQRPAEGEIAERIVPVIRPTAWLTAAKAQTGRDMIADGLAMPLGRALCITFAAEYVDRRVPQLDWSGLEAVKPADLLELALRNQRRMAQDSIGDLLATDVHMGDGTFFLRSKNLQAASLILQPFVWSLINQFAPEPPKTVLGAVVGPDAILFGPADPDELEMHAELLQSALCGLRKSFGAPDDWGREVFTFAEGSMLPQCVPDPGRQQRGDLNQS